MCDNQDMKSILQQIKFDSHSPSIARVNVPLANFDEFSKAFNCPVDSRMNPKDKCIVW